jgi:uncharacterized membrane protein
MKTNPKILLIFIFVLSFVLRVYKIDSYGLYFDEKVTLLVSQGISPEGANQVKLFAKPFFTSAEFCSPKTINDFFIAVARGDWGNSPLHYLFLHFWIYLFGITDFSVRFSSLVWSVGLIPLIYLFVKRHFSDIKLALVCAFLASIEPFFIAQSHIVRNYSMSIFLTFLASYFFFEILKNTVSKKIYFFYSISVASSLLCHYLTFPVFVAHCLIFVGYNRNLKKLGYMALSTIMPFGLLISWLTFGGGKYSYKTMQDVAAFYKNIAENPPSPNPYTGLIDKISFSTINHKLFPVLTDLFLATNSISSHLVGNRNILIMLCFAICLAFLILRFIKSDLKVYIWLFYALAGFQFLCYSIYPLTFVLTCSVLVLVIIFVYNKKFNKIDFWVLFMIVVPILLMLLQVVNAGHTFSINQRYLAFTFPFAIILCGQFIFHSFRLIRPFGLFLAITLLVIGYNNYKVLLSIYDDKNAKYTFFERPRSVNPHAKAALFIENSYEKGDTIYLPNISRGTFSDVGYQAENKSVFDSQLINLYLCKQLTLVEKVNPIRSTKLLLKKADGKVVPLFDFKDKIY